MVTLYEYVDRMAHALVTGSTNSMNLPAAVTLPLAVVIFVRKVHLKKRCFKLVGLLYIPPQESDVTNEL